MAPKKHTTKGDARKLHKEWYCICTSEKCGGEEQKVLLALVVGGKGKRKQAMCAGCREDLGPDTKMFKQ